jgi:haloacetate dehalogenase
VVVPDLRGYGDSEKARDGYDKKTMARDIHELMVTLGHQHYSVVGHDRGARVAHRLVLDHPGRVEKLCVMDVIPTLAHFERADMAFGMGYYHWFWLAQPHDRPERMILRDIEDWFDLHTAREPKDKSFFHPDARADYLRALRTEGTVAAICEDYRAATAIDLDHDRASRTAGERITCPLLALWGAKGAIPRWYDALAVWREYATGPLEGGPVNSGHYLAEEAPEEVLGWLDRFI